MKQNRSRTLLWLVMALALAAGGAVQARQDPPADDRPPLFAFEDYLMLPLRVHLIRAEEAEVLNSTMNPDQARELVRRTNEIWAQAGIQFWVESVVVSVAANQAEWLERNDRSGAGITRIRPTENRSDQTMHLYVIRAGMGPNGTARGGVSYVRERPGSRRVPGGHDWPMARVTGHELGHNLGLRHRQDRTNLLASGTRGWELNAAEAERSRGRARQRDYHRTPEALLADAEKLREEGKTEAARDMLRAITQIPVAHSLKWRAYEQLAEIEGG